MKKVLSVFLATVMVFCAFSVASFAGENDDLVFAVASDLHYNKPRAQLEGPSNVEETMPLNEDPIYWYANRRAAMEDESGFIIDEFLEQCKEKQNGEYVYDYVLIPGDMADDGKTLPDDHRAVAEKLKAFKDETGIPVYVIDGNHDCGTGCETTPEVFKEIYAEFGMNYATGDDLSYTADLGEKYRLIALDSCAYDKSTEDGMNAAKVKWVLDEAAKAKEEEREPVLMMHHNLLDHLPLQRILSRNFIVKFHYSTAELFADAGIRIVLTGHEHCSDSTSYTSALGNTIYDFANTSLTMYPLQYKVFTFTESQIKYETKTITSIDTDALQSAVSGYSREQINLMNEDLNKYAKGFLKAGVQYRLEIGLTEEKLGIAEDSLFYDLVMGAVGTLREILSAPLYGEENSVEAKAAEYGIEIPATPYTTGWDLATDLVAAHYAGEEAYKLDGPEVTALLRTAAYIIREEFIFLSDDVLFKAGDAVLADFGYEGLGEIIVKDYASSYGAINPAEYFIVSLASPLLYQFAYDDDGVNDNDGVIEINGASDFNVLDNGLSGFFKTILQKLQYIIHYILRLSDIIK